MIKAIVIAILLVSSSAMCFSEDDKKYVSISEKEKVVLVITYLQKGTRSEGQSGVLMQEGSEIKGKKGDLMEINGVKLKHYGDDRKLMWDISGWNYEDKDLIKTSYGDK